MEQQKNLEKKIITMVESIVHKVWSEYDLYDKSPASFYISFKEMNYNNGKAIATINVSGEHAVFMKGNIDIAVENYNSENELLNKLTEKINSQVEYNFALLR